MFDDNILDARVFCRGTNILSRIITIMKKHGIGRTDISWWDEMRWNSFIYIETGPIDQCFYFVKLLGCIINNRKKKEMKREDCIEGTEMEYATQTRRNEMPWKNRHWEFLGKCRLADGYIYCRYTPSLFVAYCTVHRQLTLPYYIVPGMIYYRKSHIVLYLIENSLGT